jgi:glycine/D-amino acid oxidase-like deaminating enzyme
MDTEGGKAARMNADVVVVGAGIIGTSCAYFLAQAGMKVCVVERAGVAGGTSGAGEGNILVSDKEPGPELELAKMGCTLWKALAEELPHDFEFEEKGGVVVAETESHLASLRHRVAELRAAGVEASMLDEKSMREAEPCMAHDLSGAAWFPQDCQVQPMLACAALMKEAVRSGATLLDHTEVIGIERDRRGAILEVSTTAGAISTPRVVDAAGPWSRKIAAMVGHDLPVQPRKGHIVVTEPLPNLVRHKVWEASYTDAVNSNEAATQVASVVEGTRSGTILLGSSRQLVGFDATIDIEVVRAIAARAVRYFPFLASVHALRAYVGFRPFSPDHLPVIGAVEEVPGFFISAGHEGAGIGTGPISSRSLARTILGEDTELDMAPFRPGRWEPAGVQGSSPAGSLGMSPISQ